VRRFKEVVWAGEMMVMNVTHHGEDFGEKGWIKEDWKLEK
jgi:hypothetical protein